MRGRLIAMLVCGAALLPLATVGPVQAAPAQAAAPAHTGPKKSVSVDVVGAPEAMGGTTTNEALIAMFSEALLNDGRFIVVERTALPNILAEQGAGTTAETKAQGGQLLGASALVRATVTKFEPNAGGAGVSIAGLPSFGGFAPGAGLKGQYAVVEISLRVIDTTTGEVIATSKAEGRASSTSTNVGIVDTRTGANLGLNTFKTTPLGKAAEQAIAGAVDKIALGLEKVPWSAQIVEAANGSAYLNIGADDNIAPGTVLHVYRKNRALTDPATGAVLEVLMDNVGSVEVQEVREKVSTAKVVDGVPIRGDIVKLQ